MYLCRQASVSRLATSVCILVSYAQKIFGNTFGPSKPSQANGNGKGDLSELLKVTPCFSAAVNGQDKLSPPTRLANDDNSTTRQLDNSVKALHREASDKKSHVAASRTMQTNMR
ncbi:hypothetical protein B0J14DRAFT_564366 [Halenospora varia]|nr:hypothetical protein B0J14DRAFT_564366 [Halenospora varia]